jgi:hypothetical protein
VVEGGPTDTVNPTVPTVKLVLAPGAGALFPAASVAVPAAILIPRDPVPVMEEMVMVRVLVPEPLTATVPLAVPVLLRVISLLVRVTESAPL